MVINRASDISSYFLSGFAEELHLQKRLREKDAFSQPGF